MKDPLTTTKEQVLVLFSNPKLDGIKETSKMMQNTDKEFRFCSEKASTRVTLPMALDTKKDSTPIFLIMFTMGTGSSESCTVKACCKTISQPI